MRTRRPFYRSRPGRLLWMSTLVMALFCVAVPYLPGVAVFDFEPLPPALLAMLLLITALYIAASELAKRLIYHQRVPDSPTMPA